MMVRTAGRNSRPKMEAPRVPREKVDVVVLAASHIHMQSDKRWVWFLSFGRTRSIPRDSTLSSRSTIFHNWVGVRNRMNSKAWGKALCQGVPFFLGPHPRNSAVHAFQSSPRRLPCYHEPSRCQSYCRPSRHGYATGLFEDGGSRDTRRSPTQPARSTVIYSRREVPDTTPGPVAWERLW